MTIVHRAPGAGRLDQVLGQARHREPDQGRLDRRAVQHAGRRDHARRRRGRAGRRAATRLPADAVFLLTGYISDNRLLRTAGVEIDPRDVRPGAQSGDLRDQRQGTLRDRRDGGGKGQSGKIFIENGRFHGQQVIDAIAARSWNMTKRQWVSARPVPLVAGDEHFHLQQLDQRSAAIEQRRRARAAPAFPPVRTPGTAPAR